MKDFSLRTIRTFGLLAGLALSFHSGLRAETPEATLEGDDALAAKVRNHVTFLSDDLLEGRAAGTRGHELAALYMATQAQRIGLAPAGDHGTYFQRVKLLEAKTDLEAGQLRLNTAEPFSLSAPSDGVVSLAPGETELTLEAPAVFIGYGVRADEFGHDDLRGVDLKGKIAVVLSGAPPWLPSEPRAHFSSTKLEVLATTGAVGVVTLTTPRDERRRPWAFAINSARFPTMRLIQEDGSLFEGYPELRLRATLGLLGARSLVKAAGFTFEDWVARADERQTLRVELPASLSLAARASVRRAESVNVLGRWEGTDPTLAEQPLVITCHLDHIGIGPAVEGDTIYNGTFDNAMGSSVVLTAFEKMVAEGKRGRRPVLVAFVTAEEKGLLGSKWLSTRRPPGVSHFAANINIDMPVFDRSGSRELVGWGSEHSSLGATAQAAALRQGFKLVPDPSPDETIFVRSDQYSFVRTGVPAIYLGPRPDVAEESFRKTRYHKPADDLNQPIDWPSIGAYTRFVHDMLTTIATAETAPQWAEDSFFRRKFAPQVK